MIKILKENIFNLISKTLLFKKKLIINPDIVKNIFLIDDENHDTFFGYYDLCPFHINSKFHLVHRLSKVKNSVKNIEIGIYSLEEKKYKKISNSNLYNFQFGSRLSWFDLNCNYLLFNDSLNGNMLSKVIDKKNGKVIDQFDLPFFDFNQSVGRFVTTDFSKLGSFRLGYGYKGQYYNNYFKKNNSIFIFDSSKKIGKELLNISEADKLNKQYTKLNFDISYFNHLKFSPDGEILIFLYVWVKNSKRYSTLGIFNFNTNKIHFINFNDWNPSHFNFYDKNNIVLTINNYKKSKLLFFNLKDEIKTYLSNSNIRHDFHPYFFRNKFILNDSYPNRLGYQKLNLLNIESNINSKIIEVFSPIKFRNINKCDLHPRMNNDHHLISVDTSYNNRRSVLILELKK